MSTNREISGIDNVSAYTSRYFQLDGDYHEEHVKHDYDFDNSLDIQVRFIK